MKWRGISAIVGTLGKCILLFLWCTLLVRYYRVLHAQSCYLCSIVMRRLKMEVLLPRLCLFLPNMLSRCCALIICRQHVRAVPLFLKNSLLHPYSSAAALSPSSHRSPLSTSKRRLITMQFSANSTPFNNRTPTLCTSIWRMLDSATLSAASLRCTQSPCARVWPSRVVVGSFSHK